MASRVPTDTPVETTVNNNNPIRAHYSKGADKEQLYRAVENGDVEGVELFLNDGFSPDTRVLGFLRTRNELERLVWKEIGGGKIELSWGIGEKARGRIGYKAQFEWTLLQVAAELGNGKIVRVLRHAGADVNARPAKYHGRTALQAASAGGHREVVRALLDSGADLNAAPAQFHGRSALQAAAEGGHVAVVRMLLDSGADLSAEPAKRGGRTALQAAAGGGHVRAIEMLLDSGAEVNAKPAVSGGRTALQAAAEGGHAGMVRMLLNSGADVNAKPSAGDGRTALRAAAGDGHEAVVRMLLDSGADVNAKPAEDGGRTALQAAAEGGHEAIVQILLDSGAAVNAKPAEDGGRTALQAVSASGHEAVIHMLLDSGADVNAEPAEDGGRTALQAAAEGGHEILVQILLDSGADVNAKPAENGGRTALQGVSAGGYEAVARMLLDYGAEVNAKPAASDGRTALQAAAEGGHAAVVRMLLDAGADVNAKPSAGDGRTALRAAAGDGHETVVRILLDSGADVNAGPAEDNGRTALQAAAEGGHEAVVRMLLDSGADMNAKPAEYGGRTALQAAAGSGHESVVRMLLDSVAHVNAEPAAEDGITALQAAAGGGYEAVVRMLLDSGADVNAEPAEEDGRTALQAAAGGGYEVVVRMLLDSGADVNAKPVVEDGRTALQAAAGGGHEAVVRILLDYGAHVNAEPAAEDGRTALQAAAGGGHATVVQMLLGSGAEVNAKPAEYSGRTALQAAAGDGQVAIVQMLLDSQAEVNAKPAEYGGRTALQAAARGGHAAVVQILLDSGASKNTEQVIFLAASARSPSVLKVLVDSGMDPDIWNSSGNTVLHDACEDGDLQWLSKLLACGIFDVDAQNNRAKTPLGAILARSSVPPEFLDLLIQNGACTLGMTIDQYYQIAPKKTKHWEVIILKEMERDKRWRKAITGLTTTDIQNPRSLSPDPTCRSIYFHRESSGYPWPAYPQVAKWGYVPARETNPSPIAKMTGFSFRFSNSPPWQRHRAVSMEDGLPNISRGGGQVFLLADVWFNLLVPVFDKGKPKEPAYFTTAAQGAGVSWVMATEPTEGRPGAADKPESGPIIIRSFYYKGSVRKLSLPNHSVDYLAWLLEDIRKSWRTLFDGADLHLAERNKALLQGKGKEPGLIDYLLADSQQWALCGETLELQISKWVELLEVFKENEVLYAEVREFEEKKMELEEKKEEKRRNTGNARENGKAVRGVTGPLESADIPARNQKEKSNTMSPKGNNIKAIVDLEKCIKSFQQDCLQKISGLEKRTNKMVELEFNLVSIYEARRSISMSMSMKRLSWITFVFLPLMFSSSLFGMNVNLLQENPAWWWYPVLSAPVLLLVIVVWLLFKYLKIESWIETYIGGRLEKLSVEGPAKLHIDSTPSSGPQPRPESADAPTRYGKLRLRLNRKKYRRADEEEVHEDSSKGWD